MNRRGFFKSLALLGAAAAVAPGVFVPKFEPVRWKVVRPTIYQVNPQWVTAPYEIRFIDSPGAYDLDIFKKDSFDLYGYLHERQRREAFTRYPGDPYPPRYAMKDGYLQQVPAWIPA